MISPKIPLTERETGFLLATHRSLNLTLKRYKTLINSFNSWESVFHANQLQLENSGLDKKGAEKFNQNKSKYLPEREIEILCKENAVILLYGSESYPHQLAQIHDAPAILFLRGDLLETDFPSISVVGARRISSYGKRCTETIVAPIAQANTTIVSGLAYGVDWLAHQTTVKNGSRTIAVLGSGFGKIFPTSHTQATEAWIKAEKMVLISEFFPDTEARPEHFPRRNRIITGLSKATIVIDAAKKSGSLISGHLALEQDRDVFAVPGDIFAPNSEGCNQLIADNVATPALSGTQILKHLGLEQHSIHNQAKLEIPTTGIEGEIFKLLSKNQPIHVDEISRTLNIPHGQVTGTLTLMEMKGLVKNVGTQLYIKTL